MLNKNNSTISSQTNGSRSIFARIMSTENIQVIFDPKSKDAWFDTSTRVLSMPNWKGMTSEVYDLLLSHEVSHALHTPTTSWVSLTDELAGKDADDATKDVARQYINIIEDARIERLIKAKYPGLARDYNKGYEWLVQNGYMGKINDYDFSTLPLIDKINIHFKAGKHCGVTVPFTADEQKIVDMIENADDFSDVCDISRVVWDQESTANKNHKKKGNGSTRGNGEGEGEADGQEDGEGMGNGDSDDANSNRGMRETRGHIAPKSITAAATKKFFDKHRSTTDINDVPGVLPEYDLDKIIVPHSKVFGQLIEAQNSCTRCVTTLHNGQAQFNTFVSEANATVDAMVKTFLTKKAAREHHRQQEAKTGTLDMNKLSTYKWNEDLFKHFTVLPKGKNHGFILFLDWSGSMGGVVLDVVKQMYILTSFFRRIGVPFDVYAFSTNAPSNKYEEDYMKYHKETSNSLEKLQDGWHQTNHGKTGAFSSRPFYLFNFASNTMKKNEFTSSMQALFVLALGWTSHDYSGDAVPFPYWLQLGDTPLDEALIVANQLVPAFIKKNKTEIMNVVVITDGSSNCSPIQGGVYQRKATDAEISKGHSFYYGNNYSKWQDSGYILHTGTRIVNPKNGCSYPVNGRMTTNLLAQYLKDNTGCNTMMLFLSDCNQSHNVHIPGHEVMLPNGEKRDPYSRRNGTNPDLDVKFNETWNKENFLMAVSSDAGYDRWSGTPKSDSQPSFDNVFAIRIIRKPKEDVFSELDMNNTTYTRLKSQFVKSLQKKIVSRSLVNRMVEAMAKHT